MKLLFEDNLAPITSEVGFIDAPTTTVAQWFAEWDRSNQARRAVTVTSRTVEGELASLLRALLPLTSVLRKRFLFVPTTSHWTAYFDNGHMGSDAATLSHLALQLHCRVVRAVAVPDTLGTSTERGKCGRYGATIFELYGPEPRAFLNYERTLAAVNDGGHWVFTQSGKPFPFEDTKRYKARTIRDRFTPALLGEYLEHLGISAFEEKFYAPGHEGYLVERAGGVPVTGEREYSLDEARAGY